MPCLPRCRLLVLRPRWHLLDCAAFAVGRAVEVPRMLAPSPSPPRYSLLIPRLSPVGDVKRNHVDRTGAALRPRGVPVERARNAGARTARRHPHLARSSRDLAEMRPRSSRDVSEMRRGICRRGAAYVAVARHMWPRRGGLPRSSETTRGQTRSPEALGGHPEVTRGRTRSDEIRRDQTRSNAIERDRASR